jgi:hypothetical protein
MVKRSFSKPQSSRLSELFVQRCGFPADNPQDAIRALVAGLSNGGNDRDLDSLLAIRHIDRDVAIVEDLPCDGIIEPKGRTYADGFRMRLRHGQPDRRLRFTKAHEICHTFFYELVPELKFCPHTTDPIEERLCNVGAEELLMPLARIRNEAASMPASIESLESLARRFEVSLSAMLVRLRQARLWHCDLAYWHRMVDGSFALDRKTGGTRINCQFDSSILQNVWDGRGTKAGAGVTFLYFEQGGRSAAVRVYYQARRHGSSVMTLWSRRTFSGREKAPPLLRATHQRQRHETAT